jgi:predicted ATPase/class 3 adenylate cyclase
VTSGRVAAGTLTFLFTDLVDSTYLWEQREAEMAEAVARHDAILGAVVAQSGGTVVKFQGDGLMAVFDDADAATRAAVDGQRALARAPLPLPLGVRMGLCTGASRSSDGDYHGRAVNRAARTASAAHPGQILVAPSTAALLTAFAVRDLGEHRLKGLEPMRLGQVLAEGLATEFPPLAVPSIGIGVAPANAFVGRTREIEQVQALVANHAVVTLTGVGGTGKTRLAIEAASALAAQYADGARFIDLAVVTVSEDVADAVARGLGLMDNGAVDDQNTRVAAHLESRAILCILDNCEHVLDACAELVEAILARPGPCRVLATSREPLGVTGEQVYVVPSLDAHTDASALFAARATEVRPGFALEGSVAEKVGLICERLDGIPLAIELAAARVNQLTPGQLLDRLDDRFQLLTGGRRRVQRQQTLAATLDWSHDLLDDDERALLRRLAVFPSTFSLDAVEAVTGMTGFVTLGSLVTKSLVAVVDDDEEFRYRLLETVRIYAEEKLAAAGESEELRDRHASWVQRSLEAIPLEFRWFGDDARPVPISDLNAALEWSAVAGPATRTAGLAGGVEWTRFEHWRDGRRWCEAVVDDAGLDPRQRLQVLMMLNQILVFGMMADRDRAWVDRAEEAAHAAGADDPLVAMFTAWHGSTMATVAETTRDEALAHRCADAMEVGAARAAGHPPAWRASIHLLGGFGFTTLQRPEDAQRHLHAAVDAAQPEAGYAGIHSAARAFLSLHRVVSGDVAGALALADGLVEVPEPSMFSREGLVVAAVAVAAGGDGEAARERLRRAYERTLRVDQRFGIEHVVVFAGAVAAVEEDWETAVRVLAASREGYRRTPFAYLAFLTYRDRAREALGVDRFRELRTEGRELTFGEAMALVTTGA